MVVIEGRIWNGGFTDGYVVIEEGILKEIGEGKPPEEPFHKGTVFPGMTDCHTHIADAGLVLDRKYSLEELVAPPDGLKHRYLAETPRERLMEDMGSYSKKLRYNGATNFIDFREGGIEGCKMLREVCPDSVILGRPVSKEFDPSETEGLLSVADGVGISSVSDMDRGYIDSLADAVHRNGKMLALHVSERVREDIDYVLSLEPDFVVHMCQATDEDMRKAADAGIPVVVCPRSNMYFGIRTPLDRMVREGIDIRLWTDNAMISSPHVFAEIETAGNILDSQGLNRVLAYDFAFSNKGKTLYGSRPIAAQIGKKADLTLVSENSMLIRFS